MILLDPHPRPLELIFSAADKRRLEALGPVRWHDGAAPLAPEIVDALLPEMVALIGQTPLPKERLDRAPQLKFIANVESNFLPNIDYAECHRRNIHVIATSPVFSQPVAEMALGMALGAARGIPSADAAMRAGTESLYGVADNFSCFLLQGKTMGLVGFGQIGRALLPFLRPFQGRLLVHDPWIHPHGLVENGVTPASLEEIFEQCRVVFLLAATTTDNRGAIGKKHFERMAPGSVVVLVSRAGIVNYDELLDAAASGRIKAAIDVHPEEPIPKNHRARATPNTVLSAHRAGNLPEIWTEMGTRVVDDLELVLRGLPPQRCQRAVLETVSKYRSLPVKEMAGNR